MKKNAVDTGKAPRAIGPYSQAVSVSSPKEWLFVSGQIPIDPNTSKLILGGIAIQAQRVLKNIEAILEKGGYSKRDLIRLEIFLTDFQNFKEVGDLLSEWLKEISILPARQTIEVKALPLQASIEISCIAAKGDA